MSDIRVEVLNIVISLASLCLIHWQTSKLERRDGYARERIGAIDALKGICIIGVVFIHAAYLTPFNLTFCRSLDFAVPFFFIASGFLLSARFEGTLNAREFYRKLFFRVVLIYLIFVVGTRIFKGGEMTAQAVILDALLGRTNYNYYFIPLILQFYLLFPFLIRYRERLNNPFVFCMVALFSFISFMGNHYVEQPYWDSNPYYLIFIGKDFSYFCFGMFISQYDVSRLHFRNYSLSLLIFLAGAVCLMLLTGEYLLTYAYPFAAFVFSVAAYNLIKGQGWLRIMEDLGRQTLVIYLVHSTLQGSLVVKYFYNEKHPWGIELVLVVCITLILSYGFSKVFMAVYNPAVAYCLQTRKKQ